MKEEDMKEIATLIKMTITDFDNTADQVRERVSALCKKASLYMSDGLQILKEFFTGLY